MLRLAALLLSFQAIKPVPPAPAKPAVPPAPVNTRNFTVTSVPTIVVSKFADGARTVIGPDGTARTCPDAVNVHMYIRVESKTAPDVFQQVPSGSFLLSKPGQGFTLACLKVD